MATVNEISNLSWLEIFHIDCDLSHLFDNAREGIVSEDEFLLSSREDGDLSTKGCGNNLIVISHKITAH